MGEGLSPSPCEGWAHTWGAVGTPGWGRALSDAGGHSVDQLGDLESGFGLHNLLSHLRLRARPKVSSTSIPREEMGHSPSREQSPATSAHSTIWDSGKCQRNPERPGSPETLQGTSHGDKQCAGFPLPPAPSPVHHLSLTRQVASRLPHAPHWGVLRLLAACRTQERVILQLGEALGAAGGTADRARHHEGRWAPQKVPGAGPVAPQPTAAGKSLLQAGTMVTNADSVTRQGLFRGSRALLGDRRCLARGSARLRYHWQQLLP